MVLTLYIVLLVVLAPQRVQGQNFGLPPQLATGLLGMGQFSPYNQFGNPWNQRQQQEDVMTCINSNPQDPSSLIRLTISSHDVVGRSPLLMYGRQGDDEIPRDWQINGYYKPSTVNPVSGSFRVVVTQYGRIHDGCNAAAMGPAVTSYSPFGPVSLLSPLLGLAGRGRRPAGLLSNPLFVTQGGVTVYSARLQRVTRSQLLGGAMAVCPQVGNDGECVGAVLQCCSIIRDQLPASQVYLNPAQGTTLPLPPGGFNTFGGSGVAAGQTVRIFPN